MLRPAGGFSGGGSRPPVNIEVNFLAGDNNAFKQAREDVKALKADLDNLARHQFFNGGGGGGGFAPGGGGGGGIPTAPGTIPTPIPGGGGRRRPPSPNTPGNPSGPYGPDVPMGFFNSSVDRRDTDQRKRDHAEYLAWFAASQARYADNARRMATDDAEHLARQAAKVTDAYKAAQAAQASLTGASSAVQPFAAFGGGSGRSIDFLQANINRRRQGLPDLADPTIAAAAANVAATAPVRGAAGGFLAGGMALPAAVFAGIAGGIGANTPQGIEAIGGIGGFLEGATRREGFASQYFESARTILRPVFNLDGYGNPVTGFRNLALGPFADQARTGDRVNRMLANQSAGNMGYQLGQMTSLSSTGVGLSAIEQAKAQNALRTSQLEDQVFNRASLGPDQRLSAIEELKSTYQAGLDIKRQELLASQGVLDAKLREKEAAEQMAAAQFSSLAQMGRGDLRKLERDFTSIKGGSRDLNAANRLAASGIVPPEVSQIQEAYVKDIAPNLSAFVEKAREDMRKAAAEQQLKVDALTKEIGTAGDGLVKSFTGLTGEMVKKFQQLEAVAKDAIDQLVTQKKNDSVKNGQPSRAPGAGIRGPGVAG